MANTPVIESFRFQAETTQLLHLMIHSLYTQREVFLRELASNASERLLQKGKGGGSNSALLELNPDHAIITRLYDRFGSNGDGPAIGDSIELLSNSPSWRKDRRLPIPSG
jgi:hypothetical protein